jgi:hypothetical protein
MYMQSVFLKYKFHEKSVLAEFVVLLHFMFTHSLMELLEKLPIVQPLKKFPAFCGTRRFINVFTRALHWSLS